MSKKEEIKEITTTSEIIDKIADQYTEIPKRYVLAICHSMLEECADVVENGKSLRLNKIGILKIRKRAARKGRNPKTGDAVEIPPKWSCHFRVAANLKTALEEMTKKIN